MPRTISEIAFEIKVNWKNVNFAARPYLAAMTGMNNLTDVYGCDSADSIVRYFLSNAGSWRGDVARRVKAELKTMLKEFGNG